MNKFLKNSVVIVLTLFAVNTNADIYCEVESGSVTGIPNIQEKAFTRVLESGKSILEVKEQKSGRWRLTIDNVHVGTCDGERYCEDWGSTMFSIYADSKFFFRRYGVLKELEFMSGFEMALVQLVGTCYTDASKASQL